MNLEKRIAALDVIHPRLFVGEAKVIIKELQAEIENKDHIIKEYKALCERYSQIFKQATDIMGEVK